MVYVARHSWACLSSSVEMGLIRGMVQGIPSSPSTLYAICDATVTWWPRHQTILKSLAIKITTVVPCPMGVDKTIFKPTESRGSFGNPFCVYRWELPLYQMAAWPVHVMPWVIKECATPLFMPIICHEISTGVMPLIMKNGTLYKSLSGQSSFTTWPD